MTITVSTPLAADLPRVIAALASFQNDDGGPAQLHPGDVGWHQREGADATARVLRVWERDGEPVVIGMGDGEVIRLAVSPLVADDAEVAARLGDDLGGRGSVGDGVASVEVRHGAALRRTLQARGWTDGEAWACFTLDLSDAVPAHGMRIAAVDGAAVDGAAVDGAALSEAVVRDAVAAHLASWERSTFTTDRFHAMAAGPAYSRARFLVLYAGHVPVATACVWSAGPGRPGLIEPLGVSREHRGHGYGRAMVSACAAALRDLGASAMQVSTPATQWPAVPHYAATMRRLPDVCDLTRPVSGQGDE